MEGTYIVKWNNLFKVFLNLFFIKIGIIGGSGLDDPSLIQNYKEIEIDTPFGRPSSKLITGKIKGVDVVFLARHDKTHTIPPTYINNKANIYALKKQGCEFILGTTACGSLQENIRPGEFVILDQFIDFTRRRDVSYYKMFEPKNAKHTSMAWPFSRVLRKKLAQACRDLNYKYHWRGTTVTVEGARFSTIAESKMFQIWGGDVVNMSTAPKAILANEAEIPYAIIAMVTDYDCWRPSIEPVTWEMVIKVFNDNADRVKKVLVKVIESFNEDSQKLEIKNSIRSLPNWPKEGVIYRDITTLLKDKEAMDKAIEIFVNRYKDKNIDLIAGIESRGFIIGSILAHKLGIGFIPIRKKGKLPYETIKEEYELEYGTDIIEIHKDAIHPGQRVLIVDDLIATGGTAKAAAHLVEKLGGEIVEFVFIIDLPDLGGKRRLVSILYFRLWSLKGNKMEFSKEAIRYLKENVGAREIIELLKPGEENALVSYCLGGCKFGVASEKKGIEIRYRGRGALEVRAIARRMGELGILDRVPNSPRTHEMFYIKGESLKVNGNGHISWLDGFVYQPETRRELSELISKE